MQQKIQSGRLVRFIFEEDQDLTAESLQNYLSVMFESLSKDPWPYQKDKVAMLGRLEQDVDLGNLRDKLAQKFNKIVLSEGYKEECIPSGVMGCKITMLPNTPAHKTNYAFVGASVR
ncbi:MAG: hypothetical protein CL561_08530 [Alphaproteobacteria bacterium]|nr:hypothetical protein [Alphaproteobacteria bacterium]|tara:strand:+ start:313 stop:663 length:351 start_codon:yes stop_codon:yes gene_type:complete